MTVSDAVATRRSIRSFSDRPVSLALLRRVLDQARLAPSGCNLQPWQATVLTGEPLHALQEALRTAPMQRPAEYTIVPPDLPASYVARQHEMAACMYAAEGVARDDVAGRQALAARNLTSFGAPVLLLCHLRREMGPPQWADVGMWLQTVMLLLREAGLDSCPQEYMALYGRLIKQQIGVDDATSILFCGLAIGYAAADRPVNAFVRPRAPLEELVTFAGF